MSATNERSKPGEEKCNKTILGLSFLVTISMYIIAEVGK